MSPSLGGTGEGEVEGKGEGEGEGKEVCGGEEWGSGRERSDGSGGGVRVREGRKGTAYTSSGTTQLLLQATPK